VTELYLIWLAVRISVALLLVALVVSYFVNWGDAKRWRRFVRLYRMHQDPDSRALEVLELAEATDTEGDDARLRRGFRGAARRGWLEDTH
jgi:hypothetical protein